MLIAEDGSLEVHHLYLGTVSNRLQMVVSMSAEDRGLQLPANQEAMYLWDGKKTVEPERSL